jgi:pimeloyl-ACP methyl ester carboxylesterase
MRVIWRLTIYFFLLMGIWVFLAQCFVAKNRLSDSKAQSIFKGKNTPLQIYDTLIDERHLHYAISGNADLPTLVFIHGSPGSWMNYMKFMYDSALLKKFRIVSIDRPGFGYSDFGEAMHLKNQSALIMTVLKSIKTSKPMYLCGHSMGGPVAVQLAATDSNLFERIIIVAGALDVSLEKKETWRRIMQNKPLYWFLPGAFAPSNTELLFLKDDLKLLQYEFQKVTSHVLFIHGSKDAWVPIENISYGTKMMTNAKSIKADTLFGADHQIPWKNRDELKNILLDLY